MLLMVSPSCKKKHSEAVKSDLKDAGYKLTPDDWFRASRENNVSALKKFVSTGFAADSRNAEGNSALHLAAAGGAQGAADYLLNRGLSIDVRGSNERTPLMEAVMADQTEMVRWLLRQGADPRLKDKEGFKPLMLAVREGKSGAVEELAPYNREDLDPALLLAALVGRADVIDSLTNFGSSVYARMEDGRTPLMIAAENGHTESVKLLLDIGASRFTTDPEGRTAADIATAAGHSEIAALITRDPSLAELALESPAEIAKSLDQLVNNATAKASATSPGKALSPTGAAIPIEGETLSPPVASLSVAVGKTPVSNTAPGSPPEVRAAEPFSMPPLVMRQYREKEVPVQVKSVQGEIATVSLKGAAPRDVKVRVGDPIPGSKLVVVRVQRRMEDSKVNLGKTSEISVVEVRDGATGQTREWISGNPSNAHDPVALVEDAATGKRYVAAPGQRFKGGDGAEYLISAVRPNQMVIQDLATGAVQTIPLRGPRG
jgi:ankyrin repeat protein